MESIFDSSLRLNTAGGDLRYIIYIGNQLAAMNLFLHVDYEKVYFRGGLVCNVLCWYRFLERTTLLVLSECLSISHIIAMQLLYHGLPPFKQDYHSRQVLNNCKCDSAIASQCNFIDVFQLP